MRGKPRPFILEIRQKRGNPKKSRSIWGDLDLSAVVAETTIESEGMELSSRQLIDSDMSPIDAEDGYKPRTEHLMADLKDAESAQTPTEAPATGAAVGTKKKAPPPKAANARPKPPAPKVAAKSVPAAVEPPAIVRKPRKVHSEAERAQKLGQIEKSVGRGESIKSAAKQAGISEQTYYQWKKGAVPASECNDLKDLLALEEENARLKTLLAERLRKENAELKKKLGLD